MASGDDLYLGLDFGTSGARATVVDDDGNVHADTKAAYMAGAEQDWARAWETALWQLLESTPGDMRERVASVAIDGTSATALLVDKSDGTVLQPPKLYNEAQGDDAVKAAKAIAPPAHTATASTSTLCKLLTWHHVGAWQAAAAAGRQPVLLHHADWLASLLHGDRTVSDWNNALKLGFDPETEAYPEWLTSQPFAHMMPARVLAPGSPAGLVTAARGGLRPSCIVAAGTTDSIAAFVAAGVDSPGQAVTSLGSSLAVKLISTTRVDDAAYGVYSHRLGDVWLVGGASNTGGAILRSLFTDDKLVELTQGIELRSLFSDAPTGLDYYPLTKPGERFPINDPTLLPRLEPQPVDDVTFLQGIFESIARIEADAYARLTQLGATPVTQVLTAGGGAVNPAWTRLRARAIGVPVAPAAHGDASYGAALLARQAARGTAGHKQRA